MPRLDAIQAGKLVNRAFRDICDSYPRWSFLTGRTAIPIPAIITTGTVAVEQFNPQVQFDAAATAALDALTMNAPVTQRQLQVTGGSPYNILTYDTGVGTATISPCTPTSDSNPGYLEPTDASASFTITKRYYAPPSSDFLRWVTVINAIVPYQCWLNVPIQVIDMYDPKRMIVGNPYVVAQFAEGVDPLGSGEQVPIYELYPCPTAVMTLQATYQKRGSSLFASNTDVLPNPVPSDLLMSRAQFRAYEWAAANVGRFPELKGSNWAQLMRDSATMYEDRLWRAKKQDKETFATAAVIPNKIGLYPLPWMSASDLQYNSMSADILYSGSLWP